MADSTQEDRTEEALAEFQAAAKTATALNLELNAGHDLNLKNLGKFLTIEDIQEVSIGHALICDALKIGLDATVKAYLKELQR